MKRNQEINTLKESLSELIDSEGKNREKLKDKIIQEFCESDNGKHWFFFSLQCPFNLLQ